MTASSDWQLSWVEDRDESVRIAEKQTDLTLLSVLENPQLHDFLDIAAAAQVMSYRARKFHEENEQC